MHLSMYFKKLSFGICWAQIPKDNLNLRFSLPRSVKFLAFIFSNLKPLPLLLSSSDGSPTKQKDIFIVFFTPIILLLLYSIFFSYLSLMFWIISSNASCSSPVGYFLHCIQSFPAPSFGFGFFFFFTWKEEVHSLFYPLLPHYQVEVINVKSLVCILPYLFLYQASLYRYIGSLKKKKKTFFFRAALCLR